MTSDRLVTCWFVIPIVRNSNRNKKHPPVLWRLLEDALCREISSGLTGPRTFFGYEDVELLPGVWIPERKRIEDESRKYTVFVPESRIEQLRSLLKRAANSFDQLSIALDVRGDPEFVVPEPEQKDGFLE